MSQSLNAIHHQVLLNITGRILQEKSGGLVQALRKWGPTRTSEKGSFRGAVGFDVTFLKAWHGVNIALIQEEGAEITRGRLGRGRAYGTHERPVVQYITFFKPGEGRHVTVSDNPGNPSASFPVVIPATHFFRRSIAQASPKITKAFRAAGKDITGDLELYWSRRKRIPFKLPLMFEKM